MCNYITLAHYSRPEPLRGTKYICTLQQFHGNGELGELASMLCKQKSATIFDCSITSLFSWLCIVDSITVNKSQWDHVPVQCLHFIAFHALGIIAGIAGIVVGIVWDGSGNLCTKRFVCKHLYASQINTKGPPWFGFSMHTNHLCTKDKLNVTAICIWTHHKVWPNPLHQVLGLNLN